MLVGGFVGVGYLSHRADQQRLADLTLRFGADAAERIMKKMIWQGATPEMIIESIGDPIDVDEKVFKTKTKHTFKYHETGRRKYALRVIFEDGVCVGWDDKR